MGFNRPWSAYGKLHIIPDPSSTLSDADFQKAVQKADQMGAILVGKSVYLADVTDFTYKGKGGSRRGFSFHSEVERNNCLEILNGGAPAPRIAKPKVEVPQNNRASLFGRSNA